MKFENEYWILTDKQAHDCAKLLVANSECENIMDSNKPTFSFEYCFEFTKKQLERNLKLSEKERKILTLKKLIFKMKDKFDNDENIKAIFIDLEDWFHYLGEECKLNKIFRKENHATINKLADLNLKRKTLF